MGIAFSLVLVLAISGAIMVLARTAPESAPNYIDPRWCDRCRAMRPVDVWQTNTLCDLVCSECGEIIETIPMGME